jgi:hypothetical protein
MIHVCYTMLVKKRKWSARLVLWRTAVVVRNRRSYFGAGQAYSLTNVMIKCHSLLWAKFIIWQ